jgi:hypothetical protein
VIQHSKEELAMSFRTIVSIAASVIIGIACIATVSTDAFATAPHHMTHLHGHGHHGTVHSGRAVNHPSTGAAQAR